jgi:hypothetical protein
VHGISSANFNEANMIFRGQSGFPKGGKRAVDKEAIFPVSFPCSLRRVLPVSLYINADHPTAGEKEKAIAEGKNQSAGFVILFQYSEKQTRLLRGPVQARCLPEGFHDDPKETKLGASESGSRAPYERYGGHGVYSRRRTFLTGALNRGGAWRPRERPSRRPLSRGARRFGRNGRGESETAAVEVWSEETQGGINNKKDAKETRLQKILYI